MARTFAPQPLEPIRVTPPSRTAESKAEVWFFLLLRIVGVVLIARSLYIWFCFTGMMPTFAPAYSFEPSSTLQFAVLSSTAIGSLIAGLGLWLLAPWGAVLWLVLVVVDAVLFFVTPELAAVRPIIVALNLVMVTAYIAMAF
ncbi:MAG: hypothetical protein KI785_10445, partial [Devosiaceae bacterium]|nr:hypothetical protein [Devosiaceae bacterium MH13]